MEGYLYANNNKQWEKGVYAVVGQEENCLSLVQYKSEEERFAVAVILLERCELRKEHTTRTLEGLKIYPFTIVRADKSIVFAASKREERNRWMAALTVAPFHDADELTWDAEFFVNPCVICSSSWKIVGLNSKLTDFFGIHASLSTSISSLLPEPYFTNFTMQIASLIPRLQDPPPVPQLVFPFLLKREDDPVLSVAFQVSLLRRESRLYFFCQLIEAKEEEEPKLDGIDEICRGSMRTLIDSLSILSKECHILRQNQGVPVKINSDASVCQSTSSSDSLESFVVQRPHTRAVVSFKTKNSSSPVPKLSGIKGGTLSQLRHTITPPLSSRRVVTPTGDGKLHRETLKRTDGFTPRVTSRALMTSRKCLPIKRSVGNSYHSPCRIAVVGGGNTLYLALQLALTGSFVTIVEQQEQRVQHINEREWHLLEELAISSCLTACVAVVMDALESNIHSGCIRATTLAGSAVAFADVIIIETPPYPFDELFHMQVASVSNALQPGQLVFWDCGIDPSVEVSKLLSTLMPFLQDATFMCATTCRGIFEIESWSKVQLQAGKDKQITDEETDELIIKLVDEVFSRCTMERLQELTPSGVHSEISLDIAKDLLLSTQIL